MKLHFERTDIKEWNGILSSLSADQKQGKVWNRVNELLLVPSRERISVNIYKINKNTKEGDVIVVPGKVLSTGEMDHKISIAALEYSAAAAEKMKKSGCSLMDLKSIIGQKRVSIIR